MQITQPAAASKGISDDVHQEFQFVPIESSQDTAHFWLITVTTYWYEDGHRSSRVELRIRCRHCNWGYNGHHNTPVDDLILLGERSRDHVPRCKHDGRTLSLNDTSVSLDC